MEYFFGMAFFILVGILILCAVLIILGVALWKPFFTTIHLLMDNESIIGLLLVILSLIYIGSRMIERMLAKKSQDIKYHADVIGIALDYGNEVTAPMLALKTSLKLAECERILKELEQKQILSSSSAVGDATVYELAPLVYENWLPDERDYCGKVDETEEDEKKQKAWKKLPRITFIVLVTIIAPLWLLDKQMIYSDAFLTGAIIVCTLAVIRLIHVVYLAYRDYVRKTEHDVLGYVLDNQGVLYPQEIAEFTNESMSSLQPMIDRWHKNNLVTISYENDGTAIYLFPNSSHESMVYNREPNYKPQAKFKHLQEQLMMTCCYAFFYSLLAGYALMNWNNFLFYGGIGAVIGGYRVLYLIRAKEEAEKMERVAFQVAKRKNGRLTVHELAYNAVVSMEEAAKLLKKWELDGFARKMDASEEFVPVYIISGIVSKEQRRTSERV
ncbi:MULTISPECIES: hypothetical protein [Brevibacillus]|uniref:hypothetical protein n=1 Tax=Brevibacillus TaxID=55080 RepID=UPI000EDA7AA3|nr:hypothetical protein [Brevibacillus sp.]HBZ84092.1 hypothetical protein [Brevibacillus sp.]